MDHCKCGKILGKADIDGGRCTANLTYRELVLQIMRMTDEQLDSDVTVHDKRDDEFFQVSEFVGQWSDEMNAADGVLDANHPYLVFGTEEE